MRRLRVLKGSFLAKQHVYETYKRARKQGHKKGHTTTKQKGQPCRPSSLLVFHGVARRAPRPTHRALLWVVTDTFHYYYTSSWRIVFATQPKLGWPKISNIKKQYKASMVLARLRFESERQTISILFISAHLLRNEIIITVKPRGIPLASHNHI